MGKFAKPTNISVDNVAYGGIEDTPKNYMGHKHLPTDKGWSKIKSMSKKFNPWVKLQKY